MKKIVALVLAMVMVLALAATASAATVTYDLYNADGEWTGNGALTYTVEDATYDAKTKTGNVEYVTISGLTGQLFVECAKVDADFYLTMVGDDAAVMYLDKVNYVDYTMAAAYTNIGTDCGQLPGSAKAEYFVVYDAKGVPSYFVKSATAADRALLVAGELVEVAPAGLTTVAHDWDVKTVNAKHEVTEIVCAECDAVATVYATKLAAPAGAVKDATYGWIFVGAAPAADADTKVESAETFDAGIAMYVGMSVMAAAGSAVVLKKKD